MSSTKYNSVNNKPCLYRQCQVFNGLITPGKEKVFWLIFPVKIQGKEMRKEGNGQLNLMIYLKLFGSAKYKGQERLFDRTKLLNSMKYFFS